MPDARQIVFHRLHQVVALRVIIGNPLQHLTDDLVLAFLRAKARVVVVIGEVLLVQGQGDLEHFGARLLEFVFRIGEDLVGADRGFHDQAEFFCIELFA